MNGGEVESRPQSGEYPKTDIFKVVDITKVQDYKEEWMSEPVKEVLLFTLRSKDGKEVKFFQSTYNRQGKPSGNLFYGMSYENGTFYAPSVMLALREAIKDFLGKAKAAELKRESGGYNKKFFMNQKLELVKTHEKMGWQFPLKSKASYWLYKVETGEVASLEDIEEFREYFNLDDVDNLKQVEEALKGDSEEDNNDLPF